MHKGLVMFRTLALILLVLLWCSGCLVTLNKATQLPPPQTHDYQQSDSDLPTPRLLDFHFVQSDP